jgi:carboxylesterase
MTPMADALAEEGWTVSVAQLAGHGTSPVDLAGTRWSDWVASAQQAYQELQGRCRRIAIIGLSMGGSLGLYLAASESPVAVVAISTPVRVHSLLAVLSRFAGRVLPFAPVVFRLGPKERAVLPYRASYDRIPLAATEQLVYLFEATRRTLPTLRVPLLVVQGRRDWVIPRGSAREIIALARGAPSQLLWLPRSGHLATLDQDREQLVAHVKQFLRRYLADPAAKGVAAHRAPD